jgi:poly-gamma-glutamate synthesis protein (capsule biosynthesis protein)
MVSLLPKGWRVAAVDAPEQADLRLRRSNQPTGGLALEERVFLPVTSHWNLLAGLSSGALDALVSGRIGQWQEAGGSEPLPVELVSLRHAGRALSGAIHQVEGPAECAALLLERPGALALVERRALRAEMRTLWIDGRDPLSLHPSELASLGLLERLELDSDSAFEQVVQEAVAILAEPPRPPVTTIVAVGDIMLGRTVHRIMEQTGDWAAPFRRVAPLLAGADLTLANLECALTASFSPPDDPYTMRFMSSPAAVEGLLLAGIDAVSLANNHSMDFGPVGLRDTIAVLDAQSIAHVGAGENLADARRPAVLALGGAKVALLGYDGVSGAWYGAGDNRPGTAPLDPALLVEDVAAATELAEVVVPFFHWGLEYTPGPTPEQRHLARLAVDAGATLVLGAHPHWVQGIECYQGKPIFYSLGNFVFDQEWSTETKQGVVLRLYFEGSRLLGFVLEPVIIEDFHRPRLARDDERLAVLERIRASSQELLQSPTLGVTRP